MKSRDVKRAERFLKLTGYLPDEHNLDQQDIEDVAFDFVCDFDSDIGLCNEFDMWLSKKHSVSLSEFFAEYEEPHLIKDKLKVFYFYLEFLDDSKTHWGTFRNGHLSWIFSDIEEAKRNSRTIIPKMEYVPVKQLWEEV